MERTWADLKTFIQHQVLKDWSLSVFDNGSKVERCFFVSNTHIKEHICYILYIIFYFLLPLVQAPSSGSFFPSKMMKATNPYQDSAANFIFNTARIAGDWD